MSIRFNRAVHVMSAAALALIATTARAGSGADDCAEAPDVAAGSYAGTTSGANSDGAACSFSADSPDVWYRFTAGGAGALTAALCGSSFDTVVSVHESCPGTAANAIACNDDLCGFQSQVTLDLVAGDTVLVRVSGYNGANGAYALELSFDGDASPEDLNGNGIVDFADVLMVLGAWGPCSGCPEDLDVSGEVGFSDVLMVIGAWGS